MTLREVVVQETATIRIAITRKNSEIAILAKTKTLNSD